MVNTDPANPAELGAPLFQAAVAAAMEYDVEVIMSGHAAQLAVNGVAESLRIRDGSPKTVYDFIRDAHDAGTRFKICTQSTELWGRNLIPEIEEAVGAAYIIETIMNNDVVVLSY